MGEKLMKKFVLIFIVLLFVTSCNKLSSVDPINSSNEVQDIDRENQDEDEEVSETITETDQDSESDSGILYETSERVLHRQPLENYRTVFSYMPHGQMDIYSYREGDDLVIDGENILAKEMKVPNFRFEIDNNELFGINSETIGINTETGIEIYSINISGNYISDLGIDIDLSGYTGYIMGTLSDSDTKSTMLDYSVDAAYIGCKKKNQNYIMAIGYDEASHQIPVDGTVLDVLRLPSDNYVFPVRTTDDRIILYVTDSQLNILWKTAYVLKKDMEYADVVVSDYDSFLMLLNQEGGAGTVVKYNNFTELQEGVMEYNAFIECISDEGNTYVIGALDEQGMHQIIVCNRNFDILDQIDLGNDPDIHIEDVEFRYKHNQEQIEYITTTIRHNQKRLRLTLDVKNHYNSKHFVDMPESLQTPMDPDKHMVPVTYTALDDYVGYNFEETKEVNAFANKHIFIWNEQAYYFICDLITRVPHIQFNGGQKEVVAIDEELILFYEDNTYLGSYSVVGNVQLEKLLDKAFNNRSLVQYNYIDGDSKHILAVNEEQVVLIDLDNQEIHRYENTLDSSYAEDLSLFYFKGEIYLYNDQFFYTYDKDSQQFVESPLVKDDNYELDVKGEDVFLYTYEHLYKLDSSNSKLYEINPPEALTNSFYNTNNYFYYNGDGIFWGNYYYNIDESLFIQKSHYKKQPFDGTIDGTYYFYDYNGYGVMEEVENVEYYDHEYISYTIGEEPFRLIDYKKINGNEYFIEYESNNLYVLENQELRKLMDKPIRMFDRNADNLVYSGFYPKDYLSLYNLTTETDEVIVDEPVDAIHLADGDVYYLSLKDHDIYKYNIISKETTRLTQGANVHNFYMINHTIAYESEGYIFIFDIQQLTTLKSVEGEIVSIREKNNELICTNGILVFGYDLESDIYRVYSYDSSLTTLLTDFKDQLIYYSWYEDSSFIVTDIKEKKIEDEIFDSHAYPLNDTFEILDIGRFMGVSVYLKNTMTNEHYFITGFGDAHIENYGFHTTEQAYILILHDGESIYYKKRMDSDENFKWIKYTPSSGERIEVDHVTEDGKTVIKCYVRGA